MSKEEFNLKRVYEVAKALYEGQRKSILDRSLGLGEHCLSAREFVTALKGGVLQETLQHLVSCDHCRDTLVCLAQPHRKRDLLTEALQEVDGPGTRWESIRDRVEGVFAQFSGLALSRPSPVPALVGLHNAVIDVMDPFKDLTFTCDFLPAVDRTLLTEISPDSLRLTGAIQAKKSVEKFELIDFTRDGRPDLLRVTFNKAYLAPRVRNGIRNGQAVLDKIELSGTVQTGGKITFLGHAHLEFRSIKG